MQQLLRREFGGRVAVAVDAHLQWPLAGTGDVLLAQRSDAALAVWAADCAPSRSSGRMEPRWSWPTPAGVAAISGSDLIDAEPSSDATPS